MNTARMYKIPLRCPDVLKGALATLVDLPGFYHATTLINNDAYELWYTCGLHAKASVAEAFEQRLGQMIGPQDDPQTPKAAAAALGHPCLGCVYYRPPVGNRRPSCVTPGVMKHDFSCFTPRPQ